MTKHAPEVRRLLKQLKTSDDDDLFDALERLETLGDVIVPDLLNAVDNYSTTNAATVALAHLYMRTRLEVFEEALRKIAHHPNDAVRWMVNLTMGQLNAELRSKDT